MANELTRLHYRADGPAAYAAALLALVRHARASNDDFRFGPTRLLDCERDGLSLVGPDLSGPLGILTTIAGLAQVDA